MATQYTGFWATALCDGEVYIYEDLKTGIVFTTDGSLPDSDEIEHVEAYHAGKFCPVMGKQAGCRYMASVGMHTQGCHDKGLAGKW